MSRRRLAAAALALGLAAVLAVAAWPWLGAEVVAPLALLAWFLLRVFVLSIHQGVLWLAATVAVVAVAVHALRPRLAGPQPGAPPPADASPVERWHARLAARAAGLPPLTWGWDDLVELCLRAAALEHRVPADHRLHAALRAGEVPLPATIRDHLFPPPPRPTRGRVRRLLARAGGAIRGALRRWSGRARVERLEAMSEVLSFLEGPDGGGDPWRR